MDVKEKKTKIKSKEYPAVTLEQAIAFIVKLKDYPVGKPISYETAAKEMQVSITTKSFKYTISSARQFGLISTSTGNTLTFLEPANRLARPIESAQALDVLKTQCFATPKLYNELISQYSGKSMPAANTLENVLVTYHGIAPNAAKTAAQVFIDTANEVGAIKSGVISIDTTTNNASNADSNDDSADSELGESPSKEELNSKEGFDAPLSIPFGAQKKALLYMPLDITNEDAEYALEMIKLMFKKVYGVKLG